MPICDNGLRVKDWRGAKDCAILIGRSIPGVTFLVPLSRAYGRYGVVQEGAKAQDLTANQAGDSQGCLGAL